MSALSLTLSSLAVWQSNHMLQSVSGTVLTGFGALLLVVIPVWFGYSLAKLRQHHWSHTFWTLMVVFPGILLFLFVFGSGIAGWYTVQEQREWLDLQARSGEDLLEGRVTSADGQVKLQVPPGYYLWSGDPAASLELKLATPAIDVALVPVARAEVGMDLQSFADAQLARYQEGLRRLEPMRREQRTIDGHPAVVQRLLAGRERQELLVLQAVVETEQTYYQLVLLASPSLRASAQEHFDQLLEGFSLVE